MIINIKISVCFFVLLFAATMTEAYSQRKKPRTNTNDYVLATQNGKFGALDKQGKVVIPFVYHDMRLLNNNFFAVQDTDSLCTEYVIDVTQKILTEPVFCAIDSFIRGKVYQYWNGTRLIYTPDGICLTATEKHERKGLFKVYLRDSLTRKIYKPQEYLPDSVKKVELVFVSPNKYQYAALEGNFLFLYRRCKPQEITNPYLNLDLARRYNNWDTPRLLIEIKTILIYDTKTESSKAVSRSCIATFNGHYWNSIEYKPRKGT